MSTSLETPDERVGGTWARPTFSVSAPGPPDTARDSSSTHEIDARCSKENDCKIPEETEKRRRQETGKKKKKKRQEKISLLRHEKRREWGALPPSLNPSSNLEGLSSGKPRHPRATAAAHPQMAPRFAFVTLLTSDSYLAGALTTINSVLDVEPFTRHEDRTFDTVCLVSPATVGHRALQALDKVFDQVVGVEQIITQSWGNLDLLGESLPLDALSLSLCVTPWPTR